MHARKRSRTHLIEGFEWFSAFVFVFVLIFIYKYMDSKINSADKEWRSATHNNNQIFIWIIQ